MGGGLQFNLPSNRLVFLPIVADSPRWVSFEILARVGGHAARFIGLSQRVITNSLSAG